MSDMGGMIEQFDALDWQNQPFDCAGCAFTALREAGCCELKKACVNDRYALRIDRFFNWNPEAAKDCLTHPYFEVRAIAAKHVEVF